MFTVFKSYGLLVAGIAITIYAGLGINKHGPIFAERGNPEQLDGGLFPLLLLIGIAVLAYGLIEIWLNKK